MGGSQRPGDPDMDSGLNHHHPFQPPDPPLYIDSFLDLFSPPLDFKEGSSHMPEDPYMDSGLNHHHPFQPPFPPSCTSETSSDSGVSMKSDKSNDRLINFSVNSKDPSVDPEADDDGSVQPPDPPPGDPDMDSGLIHHHPFLSADPPKRDEVIQETNVGSGTETLLKNPPSWTSAGWPVVDTRLVLQREQQLREREREQLLREREQKLWEQQLLLLLRLRLDSDSSSEEEKEKEMMRRSRTEDF